MTSIGRGAVERGQSTLKQLARWSRDCRDLFNLSQEDVAQGAGTSQGAISRLESGDCVAMALVTYLAVLRFYRATAKEHGVTLPTDAMLLADPQTWPLPEGDPTRVALMRAWDGVPPRWRPLVWGHVQQLLELLHLLYAPNDQPGRVDCAGGTEEDP